MRQSQLPEGPSAARPAEMLNLSGRSGLLLVCDHASNHVPAVLAQLGLAQSRLEEHIGWDIGAAGLTRALAAKLDAPAVLAVNSRLVIDCNRAEDAADLIAAVSDGVVIPGNTNLSPADRTERVQTFHTPYHDAIDAAARPDLSAMVSIHSFTPHMRGEDRPWHVGLLFDQDDRLARRLQTELAQEAGLIIGMNAPYAPSDGVYYTLERHAVARGLLNVMIEVRNDLLSTATAISAWADRLAQGLTQATARFEGIKTNHE